MPTGKKLKIALCILIPIIIILIIWLIIYGINIKINSITSDLEYYKKRYSSVNSNYKELRDEYNNYKESQTLVNAKAEFLDENIVFVLEGYGNYYYTYDQVRKVTSGNIFTYRVYHKDIAINYGYKAFK